MLPTVDENSSEDEDEEFGRFALLGGSWVVISGVIF